MGMFCGARVLSLVSLTFGLVAAGALSLAVATEYWLYTVEAVEVTADNGTEIETASAGFPEQPFVVHMHSGLWRGCIITTDPEDGVPPEQCFNIGFDQSTERFEGADTTNTIFRAIRKTIPLFVGSLLLLLTALFLSILGTTKNDFRTIISAVVYIFSALSLAMGVIMYISAVNDEVAHHKKTQAPNKLFYYRYGWAFFFGGATFICAMVAAVSNISLYLLRYSNLEDKVVVTSHAMDPKGYLPVRIGNKFPRGLPETELAI